MFHYCYFCEQSVHYMFFMLCSITLIIHQISIFVLQNSWAGNGLKTSAISPENKLIIRSNNSEELPAFLQGEGEMLEGGLSGAFEESKFLIPTVFCAITYKSA